MVRRRRGSQEWPDRRRRVARERAGRAGRRRFRPGRRARFHRSPHALGHLGARRSAVGEQGPAGRDARCPRREHERRAARRVEGRGRERRRRDRRARRHTGLDDVHGILQAPGEPRRVDERDLARLCGAGAPRGDGLRRAAGHRRRARSDEEAGGAIDGRRRLGPRHTLQRAAAPSTRTRSSRSRKSLRRTAATTRRTSAAKDSSRTRSCGSRSASPRKRSCRCTSFT